MVPNHARYHLRYTSKFLQPLLRLPIYCITKRRKLQQNQRRFKKIFYIKVKRIQSNYALFSNKTERNKQRFIYFVHFFILDFAYTLFKAPFIESTQLFEQRHRSLFEAVFFGGKLYMRG